VSYILQGAKKGSDFPIIASGFRGWDSFFQERNSQQQPRQKEGKKEEIPYNSSKPPGKRNENPSAPAVTSLRKRKIRGPIRCLINRAACRKEKARGCCGDSGVNELRKKGTIAFFFAPKEGHNDVCSRRRGEESLLLSAMAMKESLYLEEESETTYSHGGGKQPLSSSMKQG